MKYKKLIPQNLVEKMTKDKKVRTAITKESFSYFFHFYYAHYVKYETADFQKNIIHLIESSHKEDLFVVAFRGSGKSTIITAAYPIWSILGKQGKKFVVIFCQTQTQAKQHMMNLRRELEDNDLLKKDLGPFRENNDEWGAQSIVFSNTDARITVASVEQSIRGIRHYENRPDLIICDDVEDIGSTKTRESRKKTYQWLKSEIIPAGDRNTRLVVVGNLLHEDSLLMRLKDENEKGLIDGNFLFYPLINERGECLWPGKYPNPDYVKAEKRKVGNEITWQQEYLLKIVPSDEQVIYGDWIQYYDVIPERKLTKYGSEEPWYVCIGVDLAISQKSTADYTALVPMLKIGDREHSKYYVLPQIINKRMNFPDTVKACKAMYESYKSVVNVQDIVLIIENVGYQDALPQQLKSEGIGKVRTVNPGNNDKRTRLNITSPLIQCGKILFPKEGAEELINQLVNFGVEKHDDLADAFSNVIISISDDPIITRFVGVL